MFVSMFAWAQNPTADYMEASQGLPVAGLMTLGIGLLFVGWILFVGIREVIRIRREEGQSAALDLHTVTLEGLGPTMADGGEPVALDGPKGREQAR